MTDAFWELAGPLPEDQDPPGAPAIESLGRPGITVDGRNLADILRPVYPALTRE